MSTATETTDMVLVERRDSVLTMTINRPGQKNAVNHEVAVQLASALAVLDADPRLSVGILTGAGQTFSAGMDLKAFARGETPDIPGRGLGGLTRAVIRNPLIAAVEGWALGGGFDLALACDLIVSADDTRFGFPEVTRGLIGQHGPRIRPRQYAYRAGRRVSRRAGTRQSDRRERATGAGGGEGSPASDAGPQRRRRVRASRPDHIAAGGQRGRA